MRTLSAGLAAHIQQATTTKTRCFKVRRTDGVVLGFTRLDADIAFDLGDGDGTITYKAARGFTDTANRSSASFGVDNQELDSIFGAIDVSAADVRAGLFDYAECEIFEINYADTSQGRRWLGRGRFGRAIIRDGGWTIEYRSMMQHYRREFLERFALTCRVDLGSARCGIPLDPAAWQAGTSYAVGDFVSPSTYDGFIHKCTTAGVSGSAEPAWGATTNDGTAQWTREEAWQKRSTVASGVTDNANFSLASGTPRGASTFVGGRIKFLSGLNAGLSAEIKSFGSGFAVETYLPLPFDVAAGDSVAIFPGCDKSTGVCSGTFDNIANHRGFPYITGANEVIATANPASGGASAGDGGAPLKVSQ